MKGYFGKYRRIDLTSRESSDVPLAPGIVRKYIGGVGLGVWVLLEEMAKTDEGKDLGGPVVFSPGPLSGTSVNTSAKAAVICKSPLTHRLNDSMLSSGFTLAMRGIGADALVLTGAAEEWSVLCVDEDRFWLEPAALFLGMRTSEAEESILNHLGEGWQVAVIGPAGENEVPYATLSHSGRHSGRGGVGAVMGAKRLKAIALKGSKKTIVADPQALEALKVTMQKKTAGAATEKYRSTGTLGNLLVFNRLGILPTRNFQAGNHEEAEMLSAEFQFPRQQVKGQACADCSVGCDKRINLPGAAPVRMEYENIVSLGSLLGVSDFEKVAKASQLCDEYGLDTISTGGTLAFAMECAQRGLLEMPGIQFDRGDSALEAIPQIAARKGVGEMLALGSKAMAEKMGGGVEAFAPHVKGMEIPGYHPARMQSLALGFAVGARGADHNKSAAYDLDLSGQVDRFSLEGARVESMVELEDQATLFDSLSLCKFIRRSMEAPFEQSAEILSALTGEAYSAKEIRAGMGAVQDLKKIFNQKQNWSEEEDTLPLRFFKDNGGGNLQGEAKEVGIDPKMFKISRARYYQVRGWDDSGRMIPSANLQKTLLLSTESLKDL